MFFATGNREEVLDREGNLKDAALENPAVYKSGAHFQFKVQLYYVGLLAEGGTDDAEAALDDEWRLEHPVGSR